MGQAVHGVIGLSDLIDLASQRLGARALAASDDFFAEKDNLLKPEPPVFIPGKFTDRGKWMDGWESRRKRTPGHDWCIIRLGRPGTVRAVNVDTTHFNGNQPESCTVEATEAPADATADALAGPGVAWTEIVGPTPLRPSSEHLIQANAHALGRRFTHLRLNIFPDGGVARLRAHGEVLLDWQALALRPDPVDLAAADHGALVLACNDMHFGSRHNLIMPGRALNMGDGWETRRKRGLKGGEHDWAIIRLAHRGRIERAEVDTAHFKGNHPESCSIEVLDTTVPAAPSPDAADWRPLLPRTPLGPDTIHAFDQALDAGARAAPCTHARLRIYPDGGVSRLRLWGRPVL